jgi:hypothetical protein
MSKPRFSAKLKDKVLLVAFNENGQSVYTAFMPVLQYYDGEHPWDDNVKIKELSLKTVHGFVFNDSGALEQEFESHFNIETGAFERGWQRDEQGVISEA